MKSKKKGEVVAKPNVACGLPGNVCVCLFVYHMQQLVSLVAFLRGWLGCAPISGLVMLRAKLLALYWLCYTTPRKLIF